MQSASSPLRHARLQARRSDSTRHDRAAAESHHTDVRIFIERLRRDGNIMEFDPTTALKPGDVIAVSGRTDVLVERLGKFSTEVSDPELLDVPVEAVDVILTNKAYDGKTLVELAKTDFARGVYLTKITAAPLP